jgi:hypothetical protein
MSCFIKKEREDIFATRLERETTVVAILIKKEIVKLRYHSIKETLVDTLI